MIRWVVSGVLILCTWPLVPSVIIIVLDPHELYRSLVDPDRAGIRHSNSTWLLESDEEVSCKVPTMNGLADTMEDGDYVRLYIDELIAGQRLKSTVCDQWIQEPTFLFVSHDFHIYFRFLAWYNLFKSLRDNNMERGKFRIYRIAGGDKYLFKDFEKQLFPELQVINELPTGLTCFRKIILVPKTYATIILFFQCKMQYDIRQKCNGRGLNGTTPSIFRRHILHTVASMNASSLLRMILQNHSEF